MPQPPPLRPIHPIDVAAAFAARLLPSACFPRIDRARLDFQSLLDSLHGQHPPPFRSSHITSPAPPPLDTIDPFAQVLPRALAQTYTTTRRDLHFLTMPLRGLHPPPFETKTRTDRTPTVSPPTHRFRVVSVEHPTPETVQLDLEPIDGSLQSFLPGQFLTFAIEIDGATHHRAYSICSTPETLPRVSIVVKHIAGGIVSSFLNEKIKAGDLLMAKGPAGAFTISPNPQLQRHYVMFAAGSGITPMASLIPWILDTEPLSHIDLFFGNRSEQSILFRELLNDLQAGHPDRLRIHHILSQPSEFWKGHTGRVNKQVVTETIDLLGEAGIEAEFFLCGPEPMMQEVTNSLQEKGISGSRVRRERFLSPRRSPPSVLPTTPQRGIFRGKGFARDVVIAPNATLLQAGLEAGLPLRYSCTMGGCGACKVKLHNGSVHMQEPNALTREERERGYVLACISHAQEPIEVESEECKT